MKVYKAIIHCLFSARNAEASGNMDWADTWEERLCTIEREHLPSGSGFDNGTTIDRDSKPNALKLHTAFHHMDEHGGYCGWTDHTITVKPDLLSDIDIRIGGRNRNDIKEYIGTMIWQDLNEEIDLYAMKR